VQLYGVIFGGWLFYCYLHVPEIIVPLSLK